MTTSLFIGRFQPFHLGHLDGLKQALAKSDRVIIGIGSAEENYTEDNPFTAGERFEMIEKTLSAESIEREKYIIIPIRNIQNFSLWTSHVKLLCPTFQKLFTGSHIVKELFEKHAPDIQIVKLKMNLKISATEIRKKILAQDKSWQTMVPPAITKYLKEKKAFNRLKDTRLPKK
ncbi:MAG: nicotinamide-nucleotide adenylyltransferase, nicotinamide-nucleotide adenylyltransferase [Candidatus Peregrinibacteria bacterium GW2011_GWF2_43_17]|nr:MAG: nicotinamide-nucleotide adenylyltransferase, nicotinamide-nucleotide adenylyltransferase [Candidatus Peregrinibacteria bacterium GW2011_GWF2_43_17]HAU39555.1 nicotinamide-nucleotide adenylyltransferase [Candidatus Peregrinibacteria bacterium]